VSILIRFAPSSLTAAKYDESVRRLEEAGELPPDGREYHACFGEEGKLRVSEIWDSQEQLDAFAQRLMPDTARDRDRSGSARDDAGSQHRRAPLTAGAAGWPGK
jgi:hypothetical protein